MAKSKSNEFIAQGSILAVASILVRIIGMIYRIPMTSIIGDEGNALYSYAYSIYTILLLMSSYSLPLAVSKMVSARVEQGQWKNVERTFQCAILFALLVGTVFALLVLVGAKAFTSVLYKDELAAIALRFMAPTILIMALLGVFRGFFQGLQTTKPTAVSQLLEQIINAVVSVAGAWFLFSYGAGMNKTLGADGLDSAWGAAGGALGTGAGALTALIFVFVLYLRFRKTLTTQVRQDRTGTPESYENLFRVLLAIAVPVILSTAVYNLIDLVDGSLFSYYMTTTGRDMVDRQRMWGAYSGKCLLLIHIPVSISSAMAVSLVPSLTAAYSSGKMKLVYKKINAIMKFTSTVAFPSAVGLMILAHPIVKTLFPGDSSDAWKYLVTGGIAVVMFSLSTITNSILQGIDRMKVPMFHSVISLGAHVAAAAILMWVFHLGIYGMIIGYSCFGLMMTILNLISLRNYIGYHLNWVKTIFMPFLCSLVMGAACYAVYRLTGLILPGRALPMLLAVIAAVAVYAVIILKTGLMNERDLNDLPMGGRLVRLAKKTRLL